MTFDSPAFLFGFLPVVLLLLLFLQYKGQLRLLTYALILASLVLYSWWKPISLLILLGSIIWNYFYARLLLQYHSKVILTMAIVGNVALLAYFKYLGFLANIFHSLGAPFPALSVILPLGISFFTFTQISFLLETYRGSTQEKSFVQYVLFVTFFPNLFAGPIARHADLSSQFAQNQRGLISRNIAIGLTILIIGLCKKVLLADSVGVYANLVFDATPGTQLGFIDVWMGAFAYAFQLYFDFSGYSDMAIGIAQMIGIRLPQNFHAPYRSGSIREFWKRWHMTLSRFLMENIYIPLGGNRNGEIRTLFNLFLTMLIAGLWHGAGWTFVLWGAWHGCWLGLHRIWRNIADFGWLRPLTTVIRLFAVPLTFLLTTVGWIFFRAQNVHSAFFLLYSMSGLNGLALSLDTSVLPTAFAWKRCLQLLMLLSVIIWCAPTTQEWMENAMQKQQTPTLKHDPLTLPLRWKPNMLHAFLCTIFAIAATMTLFLNQEHVFIYFQF